MSETLPVEKTETDQLAEELAKIDLPLCVEKKACFAAAPYTFEGCVPYPTSLPVECIKRTIEIVKEGSVSANLAEFAQHLWNIQGYAQRVLIGANDEPHVFRCSATGELRAIPWPLIIALVSKLLDKFVFKG